jgi:hypothetical protein
MNQDDVKEMLNRCLLMARTADDFTKRRLLDLASIYEARLQGKLPAKKLIGIAVPGENKPD